MTSLADLVVRLGRAARYWEASNSSRTRSWMSFSANANCFSEAGRAVVWVMPTPCIRSG